MVFEASMNWHWLFEILERELSSERIVLANPFKTRLIAEVQIKTDKVDARILADLLRGKLVPSVHIVGRESERSRSAPPALCFHASAHDVTQSHSSSAWRSARNEVAASGEKWLTFPYTIGGNTASAHDFLFGDPKLRNLSLGEPMQFSISWTYYKGRHLR